MPHHFAEPVIFGSFQTHQRKAQCRQGLEIAARNGEPGATSSGASKSEMKRDSQTLCNSFLLSVSEAKISSSRRKRRCFLFRATWIAHPITTHTITSPTNPLTDTPMISGTWLGVVVGDHVPEKKKKIEMRDSDHSSVSSHAGRWWWKRAAGGPELAATTRRSP